MRMRQTLPALALIHGFPALAETLPPVDISATAEIDVMQGNGYLVNEPGKSVYAKISARF